MKLFGQSLIHLALIAVQLSPVAEGAVVSRQTAHRKRSFLNPVTESKFRAERKFHDNHHRY